MLIKFVTILIFFGFLYFDSFGQTQTDSTEHVSDTIVYVPDTVIIKKTVYLPKSKRQRKDTLSWYAGLGYNYGQSFISPNPSKISYNSISAVSIYVGKKSKNLYTDIGVGLLNLNASVSYKSTLTRQGQTTKLVTDTIDIYYQLQNGILLPNYVTETKNVTNVYTYQQDSAYSHKLRLVYLQIPINITYFVSISKFKLGPSIGIKPSFLLTDINKFSHTSTIHTFLMYGNAGLNVAYQFSKQFMFETSINHQFTLSRNTDDAIGTLPFQNIGIAAKYFF